MTSTVFSFIKHHTVAAFCTLTIAFSFACYLLPIPHGETVELAMVLVPAVVAIGLAAFTEGSNGVGALLRQLTAWRLNFKWLIGILAMAFVMRLAVSVLALALGLIDAVRINPRAPVEFIILAVILFIAAAFEEIGWRGYALPRLLKAHSPLVAGLTIGVLWGTVHLALHLPGMPFEGLSLMATMAQLVSLSILITWVAVGSKNSVVLPCIFHAAQSLFVVFNEGVTLAQQNWLMAVIWSIAAALVILSSKSFRSSPRPVSNHL